MMIEAVKMIHYSFEPCIAEAVHCQNVHLGSERSEAIRIFSQCCLIPVAWWFGKVKHIALLDV